MKVGLNCTLLVREHSSFDGDKRRKAQKKIKHIFYYSGLLIYKKSLHMSSMETY